MSGDLVSLGMLMVWASRSDQELWRQAASMASVLIEFTAHDAASATGALAQTGADICVLDGGLSDANKNSVVAAARAAQQAPLIFVCGTDGVHGLDGIVGMLNKPASVEEAGKLVEICVRAKIPTRVLVVDDSGTVRSIVRKILSASHFALNVDDVAEGNAALDQLRGGKFDMVFLDYNMPGLDGFETLAQIKRECTGVAVVMMSSTGDNGVAERAQALGAHAFLKKPFYPADIDAVLERYYGLNMTRI
ncbi:MAG: response regulator [Pseudolabrys sp.]